MERCVIQQFPWSKEFSPREAIKASFDTWIHNNVQPWQSPSLMEDVIDFLLKNTHTTLTFAKRGLSGSKC